MSVVRRSRARAAVALAVSGLLTVTLTGCVAGASGDEKGADKPAPSASRTPVVVSTNLKSDQAVPVDSPLVVSASGGSLLSVTVAPAKGAPIPGKLAADGKQWVASGRLEPATTYDIKTVTLSEDGVETPGTSSFRTVPLTLDQQTWADIAPLDGETVGVGMPVVVTFDVAVTDRASMEKHMVVTSVPAQQGAWHWLSDNEAHWRPAVYWQAGTDVTVDLDINSVPAGGGIYGQESRHVEFHIGEAHIYKVDAQTHQMRVFSNGKLLRTIPITTGKEGFITRSGIKVISEKFREKRMNSETVGIAQGSAEAYDIDDVEYAMRLTNSGEFIHAAPWSTGSQGYANVSHGCTGMSTANAGWLYAMTIRGDVVEYVGTNRPMTFDNGWGDWNMPFAEYAAGSAL